MGDTTFIYGLIDSRSDELRWVGKSDDPRRRLRCHMSSFHGSAPRVAWFRELRELRLLPTLVVLEECAIDGWQEAERDWIDAMRALGHQLLNAVAGGGGSDSTTFSTAHRRAISEGHKRSPLARAAQAKAAATVRGVPKTAEHRERIGAAQRGKVIPIEARRKLSVTRKRVYAERYGARDQLIRDLAAQGLPRINIAQRLQVPYYTVGAVLRRSGA